MNILTQEAQERQAVVKQAIQNGNQYAAKNYGVSLSSVKRWDGSWKSLREKSHRPHSHPAQHTKEEEAAIRQENITAVIPNCPPLVKRFRST